MEEERMMRNTNDGDGGRGAGSEGQGIVGFGK